MKKHLAQFLRGIVLGVAMAVPGVGGGTVAVLIGIYDKLLSAINNVFKKIKENIIFLAPLVLGGLAGFMLIGTYVVAPALKAFRFPVVFLFLGMIVGGLPALYKASEFGKPKPLDLLPFAIGIAAILITTSFNATISDMTTQTGFVPFMSFIIVGALTGLALVLPGLSGAFFLATVGILENTIDFAHPNFGMLIPLAIGGIVGIFLSSFVVEKALKKYPHGTYALVFGLMAGSMYAMIRDCVTAQTTPLNGWEIVMTVLCFLIGALLVSFLSLQAGKKKEALEAQNAIEPTDGQTETSAENNI